jgi:sec-independent protein translocase protein TatB
VPGAQELIVILIVALLVFGPDRLPEFARTVARTLAKVRNEASRNVKELRSSAEIAELERELREIRGEFRGSRDELRRRGRELVGGDLLGGESSATDGADRGGTDAAARALKPREDDHPPPTDLEAT